MATPSFYATLGSSGLGELDVAVPNTNSYLVDCSLTLPSQIQGNGQSAVITTINVNDDEVVASNPGDTGLVQEIACEAGDIISIVTSSASDNDNAINAVRIRVAISEGGV